MTDERYQDGLEEPAFIISVAARMLGVHAQTLRYYERIDLIPHILRDDNGYRHYSQDDIGRIKFLCCLIKTKMPLDDVRRYAELYGYGIESNDERAAILKAHREEIVHQIDNLKSTLRLVDYKLDKLHPQHEAQLEKVTL